MPETPRRFTTTASPTLNSGGDNVLCLFFSGGLSENSVLIRLSQVVMNGRQCGVPGSRLPDPQFPAGTDSLILFVAEHLDVVAFQGRGRGERFHADTLAQQWSRVKCRPTRTFDTLYAIMVS